MNRNSQLQMLVLLMAGAGAAYIALQHPAVGTPLLVGVGVIAALGALMERDQQ